MPRVEACHNCLHAYMVMGPPPMVSDLPMIRSCRCMKTGAEERWNEEGRAKLKRQCPGWGGD